MTTGNSDLSLSRTNRNPRVALPLRWLARQLSAAGVSRIRLVDGNGQGCSAGQRHSGVVMPTLQLHRARALWRGWRGGLLGWAEGYLAGDWDTPELADLCQWGMANEAILERAFPEARLGRWWRRLWHRMHANTRRGSRRNIAYHYDLGNAFYRQWLDPGMTYSAALFGADDEPLERAQWRKNQRIIELLDPQPGQRVLEIGCGWGGFGQQLLQQRAVDWHGVTLSREQLAWARQRLSPFGQRARASLTDYRDLHGQYHRIASIEMLEAVGEENWPRYFDQLRRLLCADGCALIQVITIDAQRFAQYRRGADFIQRYVFPGGMLPTVAAVNSQAARAGLQVDYQFGFGHHYARTLQHWRQAFNQQWPHIEPLGFDERFRRLWNYYLCYCQSGFLSGAIDVHLFRLHPAP